MDIYMTVYIDNLDIEDVKDYSEHAIAKILNQNNTNIFENMPALSNYDIMSIKYAFYDNGDRLFDAGGTYKTTAEQIDDLEQKAYDYLLQIFIQAIKNNSERFIFIKNKEDAQEYINDGAFVLCETSNFILIYNGSKMIVCDFI